MIRVRHIGRIALVGGGLLVASPAVWAGGVGLTDACSPDACPTGGCSIGWQPAGSSAAGDRTPAGIWNAPAPVAGNAWDHPATAQGGRTTRGHRTAPVVRVTPVAYETAAYESPADYTPPTDYTPAVGAYDPTQDAAPFPETAAAYSDVPAPAGGVEQVAAWMQTPPCGVCIKPPGTDYPTVNVHGFFQTDAIWFDQTDKNLSQVGDAPDGADFRRARLSVSGDVFENVSYFMEYDFAQPGRPSFQDVYLDLKQMPYLPGTLRIGQWRQPFGMDALTSIKEVTFLERGLPQALVPFRQIGIGLIDPDVKDNLFWQMSAFRYPSDFFGSNVGDHGGYSAAGRLAYIFGGEGKEDPLLHVGGDYTYNNSSFNTFRYSSQPENFTGQQPGPNTPPVINSVPPFVDTGLLPAFDANLYGAELAGRLGSLHAQAEYFGVNVNRIVGDNNHFYGAYGQVGYFLTGEVRPYNRGSGTFSQIDPLHPLKKGGGWGAWEIAGRASTLNLNDGDVRGAG